MCFPAPTALSRSRSATTASSPSSPTSSATPNGRTDERFAKNPSRVRNHPQLDPLLRDEFAKRTRAGLVAALDAAGVPCSPINTVPEVFAEPQVQHRRMLRELPHPAAGRVPQVVSPLNFANAPLAFDRSPPLLGEQTAEILRELGLASQA